MKKTNFLPEMRLITAALFMVLMSCGQLLAQDIKLNFDKKPIKAALEEITKVSGYNFVWSEKTINPQTTITAQYSGSVEPVAAFLEKVFSNTGIIFKITGKQVALTMSKEVQATTNSETAKTSSVGQPDGVVKGVIKDDSGEPLVGVAIRNETTGEFSLSESDGSYSIKAQKGEIVSFSMIGMETISSVVGQSSQMNVSMSTDAILLDNVVVTGYQTISKERTTGSFAKVTTKQLESKRLSNLDNLLEGEIAGFSKGMIRGVTSMNGNASPLYVIDGFPVENTMFTQWGGLEENIPDMNLEDIESITVLKDAAATSIYGARAANGVVVIVTRKAHGNDLNLSFSATLSVKPYKYYTGNLADATTMIGLENDWATGNPSLQDPSIAASYAQDYLDNAVYQNKGIRNILNYYAGNISQSEYQSTMADLASRGHSYINDIAKYGKRARFEQQYNMSVGKASDRNNFNASFTYKNNRLEDKYSKDQSFGINFTNTTQVFKWLSIDLGSYTNYGTSTTQSYSLLSPGYSFSIYDQLVNADGSYFSSLASDRYSIYDQQILSDYGLHDMTITPLDELGYGLTQGKNFSNRTYARLNLKFTDWLKYSAGFQYEYGEYRNNQLVEKESFTARDLANSFVDYDGVSYLPYGNLYLSGNNSTSAYNFRQQLDFNKTFASKHNIVALVGFEIRHNKTEYDGTTLYNYDTEMLSHSEIDAASLVGSYYYGVWGYGNLQPDMKRELVNRYVSLYGNAAYTFDDRYAVTGSIRWDRSNLWGTDPRYQNKPTWSAGISWNIDKEQFMDVSWIDMLKFRASYGLGGNVAKDSAPYMTAYYSQNYNVGGIQASIQGRPNPSLRWENTSTINIGIDFSFFKDRLGGTIEFYDKEGRDLLANTMGIPTEGFGYSTYTINNGKMYNRGVEITLYGTAVKTRDFSFDITAIFGYNNNKVTYVDVKAPVYYLQLDYPESYPIIGNPLNSIYGYEWAGLSSEGLPQVYDSEGNAVIYQPTDLESIKYYGSYTPIYTGSLRLGFQYKNWNLSALFVYEGGHKIRNTFLPYLKSSFSSVSYSDIADFSGLVSSRINDRWMKPGDEAHTDIPRASFEYEEGYSYDLYTIYSMSNINILDATNFRMSNLALSYSLPSRACNKLKMKGARIQANAENLFTVAMSKEAKYMLGAFTTPTVSLGLSLNF